ncbi:sensor histidine kinase [Gulosibacter sp. ACHW.36C]|uniref:histidine kinase n=1 Tax=Gulosibacter sediminis TaxID=1729695 RepID=A0ABY4MXX1_9MICO|nr:HAMP domain-containing sensor histidine kinase [Gulosibacter sediminis]UQN14869.1 HAMP domain-containing histidine kinase [Gulosibacter sediminis]
MTTAIQLGFAAFLGLAVASFFFSGTQQRSATALVTGVVVVGIATVVTFLAARLRKWEHSILVITVLDFVALGLCRYGTLPDGGALSVAAFYPAIWLTLTYRTRGLVLATVLAVVTVTAPTLAIRAEGLTLAHVIVAAALPLSVFLGGRFVLGMTERLHASLANQSRLAAMSRESSGLLQSTLNNIDIAVNLIDDRGGTVVRNEAADRLIRQYGSDDGDGLHALVSIDGYFPDGVTPYRPSQSPIRRAMLGETIHDQLVLLGEPGEQQQAMAVSAYPLETEGALQGHVMVVAADVTSVQDLLRQSDSFVASVSHELRTPLTSILGYVDLAMDELEQLRSDARNGAAATLPALVRDTPALEYIEVVQRNSEQLLKLVEDLLLEQRMRSGELHIARREFDLVAFARRVLDSLRPAASARGTQLRLVAPEQLTLNADKHRIAQVIDNLVSNAIKYGGDDGDVETRLTSDQVGVTLQVLDHGPGMTADELATLFTPFARGKRAIDSAQPGTGLGMSIVDRIVRAHGGTIQASSELGSGTTITVWLPHADERQDQ